METSPSYIGLPEGIYTDTNKCKTFLLYQIWKDLEGDLFSLWTFIFRHAKHDAYPKNATISKQKHTQELWQPQMMIWSQPPHGPKSFGFSFQTFHLAVAGRFPN